MNIEPENNNNFNLKKWIDDNNSMLFLIETILIKSCDKMDTKIIQKLIFKIPNLNFNNVFLHACKTNNFNMINYFYCCSKNLDLHEAIIIAEKNKNSKLIKLLAHVLTDFCLQTKYDNACKKGDLNAIQLLILNKKIVLNYQSGFNLACKHNQIEVAEWLYGTYYNINNLGECSNAFNTGNFKLAAKLHSLKRFKNCCYV